MRQGPWSRLSRPRSGTRARARCRKRTLWRCKGLDQAHVPRGCLEVRPEVGVGYLYEGFGAPASSLAVEVGDAVLGDDVMDIVAGGGDAGAVVEHRDDAREGAALGRGGEGD